MHLTWSVVLYIADVQSLCVDFCCCKSCALYHHQLTVSVIKWGQQSILIKQKERSTSFIEIAIDQSIIKEVHKKK